LSLPSTAYINFITISVEHFNLKCEYRHSLSFAFLFFNTKTTRSFHRFTRTASENDKCLANVCRTFYNLTSNYGKWLMRWQEYIYPQFFTDLSSTGISIQIYPANAIASSFIHSFFRSFCRSHRTCRTFGGYNILAVAGNAINCYNFV